MFIGIDNGTCKFGLIHYNRIVDTQSDRGSGVVARPVYPVVVLKFPVMVWLLRVILTDHEPGMK